MNLWFKPVLTQLTSKESLTELRQGFDAMVLSFTPPEDVSL
jgi:hypothetical protein